MKRFLKPNIDRTGRIIRGISATILLTGSAFAFPELSWLGAILFASGIFVAFESLRGWCFLRACGIKTKL